MPGFDFDRAVRWAKPQSRLALRRRPDEDLPFLSVAEAGPALLLASCVYIDQLQGRAPQSVADLLQLRVVNHSAIALVELMHPVGRLDADDSRTGQAIDQIGAAIRAIPDHRVFEPDIDVLGRAAILSGVLCRLQGYARDDRPRSLHDCVLFLQALKLGLTVLTRNLADFDSLLQWVPSGRVLFYRIAAPES